MGETSTQIAAGKCAAAKGTIKAKKEAGGSVVETNKREGGVHPTIISNSGPQHTDRPAPRAKMKHNSSATITIDGGQEP